MIYLACKAACAVMDTVSRWHLRWQVHRATRHPRLRAAARTGRA